MRSTGHVSRRSLALAISSSSSSLSARANFSLCAVYPTRRTARDDPRALVPSSPRPDPCVIALAPGSRRCANPAGAFPEPVVDAPSRSHRRLRSSSARAGSLRAAGESSAPPPRRSAKGDSPLVEVLTLTLRRMPAGATPGSTGGGGGRRAGLPRGRDPPPRPPEDAPSPAPRRLFLFPGDDDGWGPTLAVFLPPPDARPVAANTVFAMPNPRAIVAVSSLAPRWTPIRVARPRREVSSPSAFVQTLKGRTTGTTAACGILGMLARRGAHGEAI